MLICPNEIGNFVCIKMIINVFCFEPFGIVEMVSSELPSTIFRPTTKSSTFDTVPIEGF